MNKIPCALCQNPLEVKNSKKGKPYVCCEDCGMQMFIRFEAGITRLQRLLDSRTAFLDQFVICTRCDVAVKLLKRKIRSPRFGRAGLYCPECDALLEDAPADWKGN